MMDSPEFGFVLLGLSVLMHLDLIFEFYALVFFSLAVGLVFPLISMCRNKLAQNEDIQVLLCKEAYEPSSPYCTMG
jgi:hypothetical protein